MHDQNDTPQEERQAHVNSLVRCPLNLFHENIQIAIAARNELIRRASAGQEVYAYQVGPDLEWRVWVRSDDPAHDDRYTPHEWTRLWLAGGAA